MHKDINEFYLTEKQKILGTGLNGTVRICVHKETNISYALKSLDKKKVKPTDLGLLRDEIRIMQDLDHPNILRLHEVFETEDHLHLVSNVCSGGDLLERLNKQKGQHYSERVACKMIFSMLGAVRFCHSRSIVHRDLKLENFLFENESSDSQLKLIDFGLSKYFEPDDKPLSDAVGTPYYVAPEVLNGEYDARCDVWSIGVITFMLLSGSPPFYGKNDGETLRAVKTKKLEFDERQFKRISPDAKNFITTCLNRRWASRITADQACEHAWFQQLHRDRVEGEDVALDVVARLQGFGRRGKFAKICMEVIAHTLQPDQIERLRNEFLKMDVHGEGEISMQDFRNALSKTLSDEELTATFHGVDFDHSGKIGYHEFLASGLSRSVLTEQNVKVAFEKIANHSNVIRKSDLRNLLGLDATSEDVDEMMRDANLSPDDTIDFKKFKSIVVDANFLSPVVRKGHVFFPETKTESRSLDKGITFTGVAPM